MLEEISLSPSLVTVLNWWAEYGLVFNRCINNTRWIPPRYIKWAHKHFENYAVVHELMLEKREELNWILRCFCGVPPQSARTVEQTIHRCNFYAPVNGFLQTCRQIQDDLLPRVSLRLGVERRSRINYIYVLHRNLRHILFSVSEHSYQSILIWFLCSWCRYTMKKIRSKQSDLVHRVRTHLTSF